MLIIIICSVLYFIYFESLNSPNNFILQYSDCEKKLYALKHVYFHNITRFKILISPRLAEGNWITLDNFPGM